MRSIPALRRLTVAERMQTVKLIDRADRYQRTHRWIGLPVAVACTFFEDQGGYLAALITYYGFLSVFPLLMILTTALGLALGGNRTCGSGWCTRR